MHKDDLVAEVLDEGDQIDTINRWYQSNLQRVPPKELYRKDLHQNDLFQKKINCPDRDEFGTIRTLI